MAKKVLTQNLLEPLDGVTAASIDINTGTGNLTIDGLASREQFLATGTVEYMQGQNPPAPSLITNNGQTTFTLKAEGGRQPSFRMPWSACNAATTWQIHLNPKVSADISAHSGGGNVKLDLAGMVANRACADSGGGNLDVAMPDNVANLDVTAKSGGGNVTVEIGRGTTGSSSIHAQSGAGNVAVRLPSGLAARIQASTGMGKLIIAPQFGKVDDKTYQSPDYDSALDRVEITLKSGAGNVSVTTK